MLEEAASTEKGPGQHQETRVLIWLCVPGRVTPTLGLRIPLCKGAVRLVVQGCFSSEAEFCDSVPVIQSYLALKPGFYRGTSPAANALFLGALCAAGVEVRPCQMEEARAEF